MIVAIFLVIFPLFWTGIVYLISRISGWADIAKSFPGGDTAEGETVYFSSLRAGRMSAYSNCLTVTVSHRGIHIKPLIFFRPGHPPLFIPWDVVNDLRRGGFGPFHATHMHFGPASERNRYYLKFFGRRLGDLIQRYAPKRLAS